MDGMAVPSPRVHPTLAMPVEDSGRADAVLITTRRCELLADNSGEFGYSAVPLVRRCVEGDDPDAWRELFLVVEETASSPVRSALRSFGVARMETETLVLELVEELYLNDCRKLRSCRAQSERQFCAWMSKVALHFTLDWVDHQKRIRARERSGVPASAPIDLRGPDEITLQARLGEWRTLMRPQDFRQLLLLAGRSTSDSSAYSSTQHRWIRRLLTRYPRLLSQ